MLKNVYKIYFSLKIFCSFIQFLNKNRHEEIIESLLKDDEGCALKYISAENLQ